MRFTDQLADRAVLRELGSRLERLRLDRDQSQQQLADEAGVSRHTLLRLEDGKSVTLTAFLRVLRASGLLDGLEQLVPESLPSPIEQLDRQGRQRQRASGGGSEPHEPWTWGTP